MLQKDEQEDQKNSQKTDKIVYQAEIWRI